MLTGGRAVLIKALDAAVPPGRWLLFTPMALAAGVGGAFLATRRTVLRW
ncbi:MAG: hypothetical protein JO287_00345 [Pseudonocardiales bacterium]|nr:hypothetical protein [Pseudonocardiales bacterium]